MVQTALREGSGTNYLQLRVQREADPFFFLISGSSSDAETLVGDVVDERGECLKPNERIRRDTIAGVSRAIMDEDCRLLIPVRPVKPGGKS